MYISQTVSSPHVSILNISSFPCMLHSAPFFPSLISLPQTIGEVLELRAVFLCDTYKTNEHKVRLLRLSWMLIECCSNGSFSVNFYIDFCTKQDQQM